MYISKQLAKLYMRSLFSYLILMPALLFSWTENYGQALTQAQAEEKPLLLAFLGVDWCPWSEKFYADVLSSNQFVQPLETSVIFVTIDFPHHKTLSPEQRSENWRLKEKFNIEQLPTLVLITPQEKEIARMGYTPDPPDQVAAQLQQILDNYHSLSGKMGYLRKASEAELQQLYNLAVSSRFPDYADRILQVALEQYRTPFFLFEQYTRLTTSHQAKKKQIRALRHELELKDVDNKQLSHFKLAVFDHLQLADKNRKPKKVIRPLKLYLKRFGNTDSENRWRIHAMIAQYLSNKGKMDDAKIHAKAAITTAPEAMRQQLSTTFASLIDG
jgi:protein disulfide-isomerase